MRRYWMATCAALLALFFVVVSSAIAGEPAAEPIDVDGLFARLDRNHDGRIDANEVDSAHQRLFRRLLDLAGADRNGSLTRAQFAAALKDRRPDRPLEQLPPQPTPAEQARYMFRRLDANGDGKIVLSEVPQPRRRQFEMLLKSLGKASDGSLNLQEFTSVYPRFAGGPQSPAKTPRPAAGATPAPAAGPPPNAEALLERLMRLDTNGDGKIDRNEARGPLKKHFDKFDTNGDGVLDRSELKRAVSKIIQARNNANATGGGAAQNKPK